jgi:hypothetical protein
MTAITLPSNIAIVGDVHLRHEVVEARLAKHDFDQVIFIGDYFDSFDDTLSTKKTAEWLQESMQKPNRTFLMGNHDIHYYPGCRKEYFCSGFSKSKQDKVQRRFNQWGELKLYHKIGDVYLTHAGIGNSYVQRILDLGINLDEWLESQVEEFMASIGDWDGRLPHWFLNWGSLRGGWCHQGGVLTMDVREYRTIDGVNQIFGHTPIFPEPILETEYICLDNSKGVGFLTTESGNIEVEVLL